jgi:hypothetical protein
VPPPTFTEQIRPPLRWWLLAALGVLALTVSYDAAGGAGWALPAALVAGAAATWWLLDQGSLHVSVDGRGLHVGRAHLPSWAIGRAEPLTADEVRRVRGPDADPRAYYALRSSVPTAVRVWVSDDADPVPWWLVSTRQPERLAAALQSGRRAVNPPGPGER